MDYLHRLYVFRKASKDVSVLIFFREQTVIKYLLAQKQFLRSNDINFYEDH